MAHYAFLDSNNIVTEVIVGVSEHELIEGLDPETWYGNFRNQVCKRTSYNTFCGEHKLGGIPFRGNYAGIGYSYDEGLDAFLTPSPFASWVVDKTFQWTPPLTRPAGEEDYVWSELQLNWIVRPSKPDASLRWKWDYTADQWVE